MRTEPNKKTINQIAGMGKAIPPTLEIVLIFFLQRNESENEANVFFDFYAENGWTNIRGSNVRDWKVKAIDWIWKKNH